MVPNGICKEEGHLARRCDDGSHVMDHTRPEHGRPGSVAESLRSIFPLTKLSAFSGVWDSQTLRSLLCYGHRTDDGRGAQCLLPCLP